MDMCGGGLTLVIEQLFISKIYIKDNMCFKDM